MTLSCVCFALAASHRVEPYQAPAPLCSLVEKEVMRRGEERGGGQIKDERTVY